MSTSFRLLRIVAVAAAAAFLALAWANQGPPPAQALFNDTDGDYIIDLAEFIAGSDPADPSSTPEDRGADFLLGGRLCSDARDNDGDGLTDEDDDGCLDSDGDIVSDAMETILGSDPNNSGSFPEGSRFDAVVEFYGFPSFTCADDWDNDQDGATDGDDPGCEAIRNDADEFDDMVEKRFGSDPANPNSVPEHEIPNPGSCSDGVDNDLDGLADGDDLACQPVENDDFADATVIPALPYTDSAKITSATRERGDPRPSCFYDLFGATVWYQFTPAADGVLVADTAGSDFDAVVSVWTQQNARLREVACAAGGFGPGLQARTAFHVTGGETYFLLIGGFVFPDQPANLTFRLAAGTPPANDDFASAMAIGSLPFSHTVDTSDATTEFGEPRFCGGASVWYRFTPSEDGLLLADSAGSGSGATIGVYTESVFGLTQVQCSGGFPARLAFEAKAGLTYLFQVSSFPFGPSPGDVTFNLAVGLPPTNDDFAGATTITALPFTETVDTLTATAELLEPTPSCTYGAFVTSTVWYRYTPSSDMYLVAEAAEAYFGALVGVYQGSSLSDLTEVACGAPYYPGNLVAFRALAGQTYYFQMGRQSYFGKFLMPAPAAGAPAGLPPAPVAGEVVFSLDTIVVPSCPPQEFSLDDPVGDQLGFFGPPPEGEQQPLDITSVSGGADSENFCLRVQFAEPIPTPDPQAGRYAYAQLDFDTDENPATGFPSSLSYSCPDGPDLGVELGIYLPIPSGILVQLYPFFERGAAGVPLPPPTEQLFAFALFEERSFQLIIPLAALGGDDAFRFGLSANNEAGFDCAPNGGGIVSPEPAGPGDVNCDGAANSIDSSLILQMFAGLIPSLPCQYAGDVNQNGGVGPIDATLILQHESGMLPSFPVG